MRLRPLCGLALKVLQNVSSSLFVAPGAAPALAEWAGAGRTRGFDAEARGAALALVLGAAATLVGGSGAALAGVVVAGSCFGGLGHPAGRRQLLRAARGRRRRRRPRRSRGPPASRHRSIRKSQAFGLPNGPAIDLDISTRSQIRYVEGFILIPIGIAAVIAGIAMIAVGENMNQQTPHSGDVYVGIGAAPGLVGGLITLAWGAGEVARNGHTRISAGPSQQPSPATAPPSAPTPPPGVAPPEVAPPASMLLPPSRGLAFQLFSIRF